MTMHHVARAWQTTRAGIILVQKPEGKRSLGRPRCRGNDYFELILNN
jgi:hypothetical protein